ncbi:MAG: LPS export ABC transporter periplasmic protein LptC [Pseudoflavonifractor sp.]|nr:LPS export ABC transporter periplasmic protein LptC [Alloprevotella sp.]MCM1116064.1 LPS export ABC transporter periplasmic protein LptC [Pseudoflavonifractor sp.]
MGKELRLCLLALALGLWSCADDERPTRNGIVDDELTPTMTTLRANTTISDSGYTRYRILAPVWLMFDNAADPHWSFPDGMHMERYDNEGKVNATIDCDSATYFTTRQTWRLDGAVDINATDGQRFLTQQLWWDKLHHTVYSDSFIHIERPERVIEGFGFKSNERMTDYFVTHTSGIFPASQFQPGARAGYDEPIDPNAPAPYDPMAAALADPIDAQRTDTAFNGVVTDTLYVSSQASQTPRRRAARAVLRRRTPYGEQHRDTTSRAEAPAERIPIHPSPTHRQQ